MEPVVDVKGLTFSYGGPVVLNSLDLTLHAGSRCLLIGMNGSGKSTLLRLIAGKSLTPHHVMVLGQHAYFNTPAGVSYLGTEWARNPVVWRDIGIDELIESVGGNKFPERRDRLLDLLDIDITWRMHKVSDGERRRVQLLLGLVTPYQVLLLDEVTVDLDLLVRRDLLNFLKEESETRGVTIIYATHIFDGIGEFATHLAHLSARKILRFLLYSEIQFPTLDASSLYNRNDSALLLVVESWMRDEFEQNKRRRKVEAPAGLTDLEKKGEDYKTYRDRYYNYWDGKS